MSFPAYPGYKDSGVDWLGHIPEGWSIKPLWALFRRHKLTGFSDEQLLSVYRDYGVIPKASRDDNFNKPSDDLGAYQLVQVGDLAINKMKAWQGSVGISSYKGIVSPAYHVYAPSHSEFPQYLHHLFRCNEYIAGYLANSKGIRVNQWDLEPQQHSRMSVLLPALQEQTQIARFLDHETARIDALIEEQQRLIELLKEKRQAEISQAVTKGLNPAVPMKDSGVEWLGEVPAHWPLPKLGHLARVLNGSTPSRDSMDYWSDGDIPWVASGSLNDYRIDLASEFITKKALKECSVEMIPRGAILVGLVGQGKTRGLAALLNIEATINQNVCAVVPDKEKVLSGYLHLYLHCIYEPLRDFGRGANQAALNCELVSALRIPLPCMEEQSRIVKYIESKLNEFDALEHYSQRSIGLMQERRSALISAAVTGKIDVGGWQSSARVPSPELVLEAV